MGARFAPDIAVRQGAADRVDPDPDFERRTLINLP